MGRTCLICELAVIPGASRGAWDNLGAASI